LADDEVEPTVIESSRPGLVVWSSLWRDRPNDRIRFTITDDGGEGSRLKWTLESPGDPPDDARLAVFGIASTTSSTVRCGSHSASRYGARM
jgi:hypothetical protein